MSKHERCGLWISLGATQFALVAELDFLLLFPLGVCSVAIGCSYITEHLSRRWIRRRRA